MVSWCSIKYKGGVSRVGRLHGGSSSSSSLTVAVRFHENRWLRVHSQVIFIVVDQHEKWSDNVKTTVDIRWIIVHGRKYETAVKQYDTLKHWLR